MKLSENTLTVLKNFAAINGGVVLQQGKVQKTMSPERSILVEAEIDDSFPETLGIYDLNKFLGNVTMLNNPELEFSKESVVFSGDIDFKFAACSPNLIVTPPNKDLPMNNIDATFTLTHADLQLMLKSAAFNDLPTISFVGKNGEIRLQAHEKSNDSSNLGSKKICDYDGADFITSFKVENLKLLPNDYEVEIIFDKFAKFTSKNNKLKYFVSVETK